MASVRLHALSGASLLIVPTAAGTSFHLESSGTTARCQDAPDIVLTSGPEGVRISVVQHHVSGNTKIPPTIAAASELPPYKDRAPIRTFTGSESFNLTGGVQERAESSWEQEMADQFTLIPPVFPTAEFSMGAFAATTDSSISAFEDPNPEFSFEDFDRSWTHVTGQQGLPPLFFHLKFNTLVRYADGQSLASYNWEIIVLELENRYQLWIRGRRRLSKPRWGIRSRQCASIRSPDSATTLSIPWMRPYMSTGKHAKKARRIAYLERPSILRRARLQYDLLPASRQTSVCLPLASRLWALKTSKTRSAEARLSIPHVQRMQQFLFACERLGEAQMSGDATSEVIIV
ncbi:hypothetical protein DFH09DRAFT_1456228 [Mycena vulgaris]|nr:hypothetical protein DFH09DRAFT_1456228 [Mycena vulgaris]